MRNSGGFTSEPGMNWRQIWLPLLGVRVAMAEMTSATSTTDNAFATITSTGGVGGAGSSVGGGGTGGAGGNGGSGPAMLIARTLRGRAIILVLHLARLALGRVLGAIARLPMTAWARVEGLRDRLRMTAWARVEGLRDRLRMTAWARVEGLRDRLRMTAWARVERLRPLLAVEASRLTPLQRLARAGFYWALSLPEARYRRSFRAAARRLPTVAPARGDLLCDCPRQGILLMIGTLGPGGAERQFVLTLKGVLARGHTDVTTAFVNLSTPDKRFFLPQLEATGIPTLEVGSEPESVLDPGVSAFIAELPRDLHEISSYAAIVAARRPSIAHLWLDDVNVKAGIAAVLTGVPRIVLSQRSLPPINFSLHRPYMREAYRWLAAAPGVVMINNSEAGARAYEEWLGLPAGTIGVVRNGFASADELLAAYRDRRGRFREEVGIPLDVLILGGVFRLTEEKRPFLWLDIAAHVRRAIPDARFLLVGDGPLRGALERRAANSDLAGSVHFTGHRNDALAAIADLDMLMLASRAEGLPNVLIEAQFLGVPAVATRVGGAPEAVDHGKSGWLLENDDPEDCGRRIVQLLRDAAWRDSASRHGPAFAFARFGAQRMIDETVSVYGLGVPPDDGPFS